MYVCMYACGCMWMNSLIIDTTKIILGRQQYRRKYELGLDSDKCCNNFSE